MRQEILEKIIAVINEIIDHLNLNTAQVDEDLTLLGMDSISFIRIVITLEEKFECEFMDDRLIMDKLNTVRKIYHEIELLKSKK